MGNIVAIIGRPNVGKSTFFNRLLSRREAIVDAVSGVTRDRHYGHSDWNGKSFSIIDTGGYIEHSEDIFQQEIDRQVELAIDEADLIVFMTDGKDGLLPIDKDVMPLLRRSSKPVLLAVNKIDTPAKQHTIHEFYQLGIADVFPISAMNGAGTGELLDRLVTLLPEQSSTEQDSSIPNLAIIGRPNVGKSSLINAFLGERRFIVTDQAGTTRDATTTEYKGFGHNFNIVDTAGIRRKPKVTENIEFYSVMRSIRAIEHADICMLLIDAENGFEGQDKKIFWLAERNKKGIMIFVNKWDLIAKETNTMKAYETKIRKQLEPFTDVPILFGSVVNKQRIHKAIEIAMDVYERRQQRIPTSKLNDLMLPIFKQQPPPMTRGRQINIKYCMQLPSATPKFVFYTNYPKEIKIPYKRFVENQLRKHFDLSGLPVDIFFRKK